MDMFKKLPNAIIENILCLIPLREAARTSILSKEWRYHWTKIPNLVLVQHEFNVSDCVHDSPPREERVGNLLTQKEGKSYWCKLFYAFYQILLKHEGPIHEFTLDVSADETCVEIEHIVYYLSTNYSVKKLTLDLLSEYYVLPLSIFSFHQLTDLRLLDCNLGYETITFNVFDSLTNLYMNRVTTWKKTLLHLLSSCPLLKSLTMISFDFYDFGIYDCTITNLLECFVMVENLSTSLDMIENFIEDSVPQVLPTKLVHLKYVDIYKMNFEYEYGLPFLLYLIRSSPNMEKLKLRMNGDYYYEDPAFQFQKCSSTLEDCSDILLEHLEILEISCLKNEETKAGLDFVRFILAKSPVLKKVRISFWWDVHMDGRELLGSEVLLSLQSASPAVKFSVDYM